MPEEYCRERLCHVQPFDADYMLPRSYRLSTRELFRAVKGNASAIVPEGKGSCKYHQTHETVTCVLALLFIVVVRQQGFSGSFKDKLRREPLSLTHPGAIYDTSQEE